MTSEEREVNRETEGAESCSQKTWLVITHQVDWRTEKSDLPSLSGYMASGTNSSHQDLAIFLA